MSSQAIETEHLDTTPASTSRRNPDLVYRLDDRPPLPQTLFAAGQHLLAMFVAVITPPLLICQALGLPAADTQRIISMSLFVSGLASFLTIRTLGPIGSGLLSIQGTSFELFRPDHRRWLGAQTRRRRCPDHDGGAVWHHHSGLL